jgi:hypothetical protein
MCELSKWLNYLDVSSPLPAYIELNPDNYINRQRYTKNLILISINMILYLKILNQKTTKLKFSLILSIAIFNKLNIKLSLCDTLLGIQTSKLFNVLLILSRTSLINAWVNCEI